MSARAPEAIHALWLAINKAVPGSVLSGIVGDTAHSFGYHLARRDLPASDYSVTLHLDRLGRDDCASALDVSLSPELMRVCTHRLLAAARAKDPRLKALREFCGTLNGISTFPWDLSTDTSEGVGSWDDSHLWHIHLSFYRAYADDAAALAPIADVFAGVPLVTDPMEEVMAMYASKQEFEDAMRAIIHDEVAQKGVRVAYINGNDNNDADPTTRDAHLPETLFAGVPGYVPVSTRETNAPKK